MRITLILLLGIFTSSLLAQVNQTPPQTKIMTLGVFHFDYPNLDAVTTDKKDQVSVLMEPYQSEIEAISKAIEEFNPTIIAIEQPPSRQYKIDSLFNLYKSGNWNLRKSEVYQLGFRLAKNLNLNGVYCVDDPGRHYSNIESLFNDSARMAKFESYYMGNTDSIYRLTVNNNKVTSIIDELRQKNDPQAVRQRLAAYLLHPFKYEEQPGDFTGVDFETGRWFNRNLRILRNIQRIPHEPNDRILLIIGNDHLNLLNMFFDVSTEYEMVSPLPYLENAKSIKVHSNR